MDRKLSVSDVRSQLPTLVREVAQGNDEIVITTRNEPMAIIVGYEAFQRQRFLSAQGARHVVDQLVEEAQALIQATQEGCRGPGEADLYLFLISFESLIHRIWEAAEEVSTAHASIASLLLDASTIYRSGERQFHPQKLGPLADIITLLLRIELTMDDAAEADRHLLAHGINAFAPIHGDLNALYAESEAEQE